tara:strand:- start:151 stop:528 length:378 start_codon:yes stop_codon:yes gene_type:complete
LIAVAQIHAAALQVPVLAQVDASLWDLRFFFKAGIRFATVVHHTPQVIFPVLRLQSDQPKPAEETTLFSTGHSKACPSTVVLFRRVIGNFFLCKSGIELCRRQIIDVRTTGIGNRLGWTGVEGRK